MSTTQSLALAVVIVSAVLLLIMSAAEASIGAISRTRLGGNGNGHTLNAVLDSYIRRRQHILRSLAVGASVTSIVMTIGLVVIFTDDGEADFRALAISGAVALFLVTGLRLSARTLALVNPETTGLLLAKPILASQVVLAPLAWVAAAPGRILVRVIGRDPDSVEPDPANELLAVLDRADDNAQSLSEERRMMRGILAMSEQTVREVMSPRIDIAALPSTASIGDAMKVINETGYSRIPIYEESLDKVLGVVYAKDLLAYLRGGQAQPSLREIARPPYHVPETKRVDDLLADMRRDQVHMGIVVDEYGGCAGVVTVEDLIEEIVGEIADEYDVEDVDVQLVSEHEAVVDARLPIDDLNELFDTEYDSEDFDTVGGLILELLGRLAVPGDEVSDEEGRLRFRVLSILGRRIKKVRVVRVAAEAEAAEAAK